MTNSSCIAFVAGKSGGHIIPGLTLAQTYCQTNPNARIIFFTTHYPLDAKIISQAPSGTQHVALTLNNASLQPHKMVLFMVHFMRAFFVSLKHLKAQKPERLISMGGYISLPVCLAAKFLNIPICVYELNAVPGKATKLLAPLAHSIAVTFTATKKYLPAQKCVTAAYPIRFSTHTKTVSKEDARQQLGLPVHKKTIFIQGGSQGSVSINNHIKNWLALNPHVQGLIAIIHQTGSVDATGWQELYAQYEIPALVFDFKSDMHLCYAAADFIISRAGAGALFETAFFEKPCIVIPLQARSTSHQQDNAYAIAQQYPHLFTVVTEEQIKHDNLALYSLVNKYLR